MQKISINSRHFNSLPKFLFFLLLLCFPLVTQAARILFFIGALSSYSHRSSIQPLANNLAARGHHITFFSPLAIPHNQHPSIQDFCPSELIDSHHYFLTRAGIGSFRSRVENKFFTELLQQLSEYFGRSELMCENILSSQSFKEWLPGKKFDLFIIDSGLNTCAFGLARYFKAKTIIYNSIGFVTMWDVTIFGIPPEISWIPGLTSKSPGGQLSIVERLFNAFMIAALSSTYKMSHLPKIERQLRQSFLAEGLENMESVETIIRNTSLMFVNNHYSDQYPKSYPSFVIPVGGIHLVEANGTLPGEMEFFIQKQMEENGKDGFVYISFGSLIKISMMNKQLLVTFMEVIRRSKWSFLFKWDGPIPENAPKNVLFNLWFPQEQVLSHPKIRGFITQGGQVSLQEAICNGVPLLILPVLGDQDFNARRMDLMGNGIMMELGELTTTKLEVALDRLIMEPSFRMNAKKLARASRERPMSALDTATWWTEHVLNYKDLNYLKPLNGDQSVWRQWDLDLWAILFCIILIWMVVTAWVVRFIVVRILFGVVSRNISWGRRGSLKFKRY